MDIYAYLRKDHQKVAELFAEIIQTKAAQKRQNLFDELKEELLLHAKTEQKTFYKALKKHSEARDEAKHGDKEHAQIENSIEKLNQLSIQSDQWLILFGELKHNVEHHVRDEEGEMFKQARKVLTKERANQLAEEMDSLKQEMLEAEAV